MSKSALPAAAAALAPLVLFMALSAAFSQQSERRAVEAMALSRAERVVMLIDSRIDADRRLLNLLSTSPSILAADQTDILDRARRIVAAEPDDWVAMRLVDRGAGRVLWDTRAGRAAPPGPALPANRSASGIVREGEGCPCVRLEAPVRGRGEGVVLEGLLSTQGFQNILVDQTPEGSVSAVVDRSGRFIARTVGYPERVGGLATSYVRDAIASEESGVYQGTTYEGFKNYTAYWTSPRSGWSAHVAVASHLISAPSWWSGAAMVIAALATVGLALMLVWLAQRDQLRRRAVDERMQQAQKMEALGQLTGGIAHDFNNLLTAILGSIDLLKKRAQLDDKSLMLADNAIEAARRGAKLTTHMLAFSRGRQITLGPVDLPALIEELKPLLERSVGADVYVNLDVFDRPAWVTTHRDQLELAILNLVVNARDAMPDGGMVTIRVRKDQAAPPTLPEGEYVRLTVADTGEGMTPEVAARAFEPFFTTKPIGKGTGLGLAQVFGVARQCGGAVEIQTSPGKGAQFHLFLPQCPPQAPVEQPKAPARKRKAPAVLNLVVCDDDPAVREFVVATLSEAGHRVEAFDAGEAALEHIKTGIVDAAILDYAMAGMNGAETAVQARDAQPDLPVLLITGFEKIAETGVGHDLPLLRKPFGSDELLAALDEIMRHR
ncbi:ATP-binding protein [Brevundimonas sp. 2R-24]|uniref:histidine kinase n=1 Tax=Peiella sedimenti TaxID=3061083 RepID=A0ABT8SQM2_9CAUL|nr:ATP-binding protein [Caulobacteraceae bacterium XZ-24]